MKIYFRKKNAKVSVVTLKYLKSLFMDIVCLAEINFCRTERLHSKPYSNLFTRGKVYLQYDIVHHRVVKQQGLHVPKRQITAYDLIEDKICKE